MPEPQGEPAEPDWPRTPIFDELVAEFHALAAEAARPSTPPGPEPGRDEPADTGPDGDDPGGDAPDTDPDGDQPGQDTADTCTQCATPPPKKQAAKRPAAKPRRAPARK